VIAVVESIEVTTKSMKANKVMVATKLMEVAKMEATGDINGKEDKLRR